MTFQREFLRRVGAGVRACSSAIGRRKYLTLAAICLVCQAQVSAQVVPVTTGTWGPPYTIGQSSSDSIPGNFSTIKDAADAALEAENDQFNDCPGYTLETEGPNETDVIGAGGGCDGVDLGDVFATWVSPSDLTNDGQDCDCDGTSPNVGDPINAATGNGTEVQEDGRWGPWLRLARYYNTNPGNLFRYLTRLSQSGQVGFNWSTSYFRRIFYQPQVGPNVPAGVLYDTEDGKEYQFGYVDGTLQPATFDYSSSPPKVTARPDVHIQMQVTQKADGTVTGFDVLRPDTLNHEHFDAKGVLVSITDDTGHVTTLTYSDASTPVSIASQPGLLITVTDPVGRQLHLTYDSSRFLATATGPDNKPIVYSHTSSLSFSKITYPNGLVRTFDSATVNGLPMLSDVKDDGKVDFSLTFNASGAVTGATHPAGANGVSVTYSPTTANVIFPEGIARTFGYTVIGGRAKLASVDGFCLSCGPNAAITYDSAFNPKIKTDFRGYQTASQYNTEGLEISRTESAGTAVARTTTTEWNLETRKRTSRSITDATGTLVAREQWAYNGRGQVVADCIYDAVANASYTCVSTGMAPATVKRTVYSYCDTVSATCPKVGLLLSIDGPRTDVSDVTTYAYSDSFGDVASVTDAVNHVTKYPAYDTTGHPTRTISPAGVVTDYTYDVHGNVTSVTVRANADGSASTGDATWLASYDHFDHLITLTDPDGVVLGYGYDDAHRLVSVLDSNNNVMAQGLNANGQITAVLISDSAQHVLAKRTTGYTNTGLLSVQADSQNRARFTATGFDGNGNLTASTDGLGTKATRSYDPLNRLSSVIQDSAGTGPTANASTSYLYDALDHVTQVTDPSGLVTTQGFDGYGQRVSLKSPDTGLATYAYDLAGNELTRTDARGITRTTQYDAINRKVAETFSQTGTDTSYFYDEANAATGCPASFPVGQLTRMVDAGVTTSFCYDRQGNISQKRQTIAGQLDVTSYTYTLGNRLASETRADGSTVTYGHDTLGNTTTVSVKAPSGAVTPIITTAAYLPFGPLSSYTVAAGTTVTRSYDADYQLNDVVAPGFAEHLGRNVMGDVVAQGDSPGASPATESYTYDPLRRLTGTLSASGTALETYTYNATGDRSAKSGGLVDNGTLAYTAGTHQVSAVGNLARTNDAAGNTTAAAQAGGTYGFGYDARGRIMLAQFNGSTVGTYTYNAIAQRVARTSVGGNPALARFTYDEAGHVVAETGSSVPRSYVWLDDLPVAVLDTTGASTAVHYVHGDALGTPRSVTDVSGNTVWSWPLRSNAFGEQAPTGSFVLNLRHPGQYADGETGIFYNVSRYYDPVTGRYLTSDPIGLTAGISTFSYVNSNPLTSTDQLGLRPLTFGEKNMLTSVFNETVDLSKVDVVSGGGMDPRAWGPIATGNAVTLGNTIHFPSANYQSDFSRAPLSDQAWLAHETTHVFQYQNNPDYSWTKAAREGIRSDTYNYGLGDQSCFSKYRFEQQAAMVADYYQALQLPWSPKIVDFETLLHQVGLGVDRDIAPVSMMGDP